VNRLIYAPLLAAAALAMPLSVAAAPTPTPSPGLDQVLVAPPSGYTELTSSPFHGEFTATDYAQASDASQASEIEATLKHDGFVDGFGKTWLQQSSAHVLLLGVLAFSGGRGARDWLIAAEAGDKKDPSYVRADTIDGIGTYYGGHFSYTDSKTVGDAFSFVKGNDVFLVAAVSTKDDVLSLAQTMSKSQYDQAPSETIPSARWPENATSSSGPSAALGFGIVAGIALVVIVLGVVLVMRARRARMAPAIPGGPYPGPAVPGYGAAGPAPAPAAGAVQMSPDFNYWWDGQAWRDASTDVPPGAQRSGDGTLWWDGRTWRPVAQPGVQLPQA
jgi:hypothetical protein